MMVVYDTEDLFMNIQAYLRKEQSIVERYLKKYAGQRTEPKVLGEAMRYSLFAPGKRLRPILTMAVADLLKFPSKYVMPAACALEMIHVYSLIHDDLPAMDDDDLRRGKPTNHKVFGEGMAILAGDTLQAEAFRVLVKFTDRKKISAVQVLSVIEELGEACGTRGMAAGQAIDLQAEGKKIQLSALRRLHYLKTGMLLRGAVRIGAVLSGASEKELRALTRYAEHVGVAFQIQDDLLDVLGDTQVLGKKVGSDEKKHKSTYPALCGVRKAQQLLEREIKAAKSALDIFDEGTEVLLSIVDYIKERNK